MGRPMALNLIRAGYDLVVWNRTADACDDLAAGGAKVLDSPAEVTAAADITIAMLSDPAACLDVAMGPNGAVAGLAGGKGYIDASTVDHGTSRMIAAAAQSTGAAFLEAPVSGSKGPAELGTLIFMTAGSMDLYEAAGPLFEAMGKTSVFLGKVGTAAKMKLVVNMIMGSMMVALAEGLTLSRETGLDPMNLLTILNQSAIASPMIKLKGPSMVEAQFTPAFPLKHQQKDMRLALETGADVGQYLPVAAAANDLYLQAVDHGKGDLDFSAVIKALQREDGN